MEDCEDEANEMTSMNFDPGRPHNDPAPETPTITSMTTTVTYTNTQTTRARRKEWLRQHLSTRIGKCVVASCVLSLIIVFVYLIAKIIVGIVYMNSCPEDPFIPIYLIISSSALLIFIIITMLVVLRYPRSEGDEESISPVHLIALVYYFIHLVLQLAGSVCVIRTWNNIQGLPEEIKNRSYCDGKLLTFAFGIVIFELVLSGLCFLITLLSLCEVAYIVCCKQNNLKHTTNNNRLINAG